MRSPKIVRLAVRMAESDKQRLVALANKEYEGNLSLTIRKLLEQASAGQMNKAKEDYKVRPEGYDAIETLVLSGPGKRMSVAAIRQESGRGNLSDVRIVRVLKSLGCELKKTAKGNLWQFPSKPVLEVSGQSQSS